MPSVNIGDCRLYFEIYGSELDLSSQPLTEKPTIICLHGGTGQLDHTYEVGFWQKLSNVAQIIFLDHRGMGRSSRSEESKWNLTQWANDVYKFCEVLDISRPYIAGDSVGGHIAMQFGILYPRFAAGLILINTEATLNRDEMIKQFREKGGEEVAAIAHKALYQADEKVAQDYAQYCLPLCSVKDIPNETFQHCTIVNEACVKYYNQEHLYTTDLSKDLIKIECPILYLASSENPFHTHESAIKTESLFKQKNLHSEIVNDTGLLQFDAPDYTLTKITEFINEYAISKKHEACVLHKSSKNGLT